MPAPGSPGRTPKTSRTRAILRAVRTGRTYDDIGREFGVTGSCIRHTARRCGLPPRIPLPRLTVHCLHCGKEVVTTIHAPRKFCSKRCFYRNRRGAHWTMRRTPEARALWIASRTRICQNCGKTFLVVSPSMAGQYCGHKCSGQARAKLKPRDLVALRAALRAKRPRTEIAAQFGVSREYVRKLAKRWRIPVPPKPKAPSLTIQCEYCGKDVITPVSCPRKFCSKRCFYRCGQATPENLAARTRTCKQCGKQFFARFARQARRFCGWKCTFAARAKVIPPLTTRHGAPPRAAGRRAARR